MSPSKRSLFCRWRNYNSKLHKLVAFGLCFCGEPVSKHKDWLKLILFTHGEANKRSLSSRAHSSSHRSRRKKQKESTRQLIKNKNPRVRRNCRKKFRASFWLLLIRRGLLASRTAFFGCELSQPPTFFKNFWSVALARFLMTLLTFVDRCKTSGATPTMDPNQARRFSWLVKELFARKTQSTTAGNSLTPLMMKKSLMAFIGLLKNLWSVRLGPLLADTKILSLPSTQLKTTTKIYVGACRAPPASPTLNLLKVQLRAAKWNGLALMTLERVVQPSSAGKLKLQLSNGLRIPLNLHLEVQDDWRLNPLNKTSLKCESNE